MNPNLVLPVGTRIVTRVEVKTDAARALRPVGAVAEIVAVPADALHSYRVRFPDGAEASLRRREFRIWRQYREEAAGGPDPLIDHERFAQHVIYRCARASPSTSSPAPFSPASPWPYWCARTCTRFTEWRSPGSGDLHPLSWERAG